MDTVAPTFVFRHTRIRILTERPAELIDLTDGLRALVSQAALTAGFVNVQTLQPTTGIAVTAPAAGPPASIGQDALPLAWAACVPVIDGHLRLDRGERVFLVERDGPRPRDIGVVMTGEGRP